MFVRGRGFSKMPCESCAVQFSVFRRKRACSECERHYCSDCLRRGGGTMCGPCRVLSTRPLSRQTISHLKVRDLQCFLQRQNISTRGCVEKEELVSLCVSHVNSGSYRRRGARTGTFTGTLKGLTNNINELINSAFDIRPTAQPAPPPSRSSCFNSMHDHVSRAQPRSPQQPTHRTTIPDNRFTTRPGGEPDIEVPLPTPETPETPSSASAGSPRVDTHDCYEIEDEDDAGWEFVTRPADPLPNDSEDLLTAASSPPRRATSELELRSLGAEPRSASPLSPASPRSPPAASSSGSLQSDLAPPAPPPRARSASHSDLSFDAPQPAGGSTNLEQMRSPEELEALSVRQLKELLARNRVEYRGAVERADLLQRARLLYADHHKYRSEIENLPLEECCKICMAAPLECVLLECGHIAACTECSRQLAECPICRQYIVRAVRFFRS
ncbi:E3 ubiquitin-protein ligase rififylin [Aricia agestis]|uniref:E3 ubiquitin-protein ligase rififylin n=1 Tax=Aricia agestis TaxID=91739 RepID=UPI001C2069E4|nr:E3 ubiquitin-protein ligase rififylin [Aricia agestis]